MGIDEHFTSVNQSGREPICCGHQYVWSDTEALPKTKEGFHSSQDSHWPFCCSWGGGPSPRLLSGCYSSVWENFHFLSWTPG